MTRIAGRGVRQERIAAYKTTLRRFIDQRPSGIRRKIAEVTGTHKSFISQITNPSDATPLPARHIDGIFAVCHLSPEEKQAFLKVKHTHSFDRLIVPCAGPCATPRPSASRRSISAITRLRQLGPLADDNLLIFRDRLPKSRHYTERLGAARRGVKTAASARAASAMPSRADAGAVRGPCSAGYGAPAPSGARRRSARGGRPSGWRRTSRRWREG